MASVSDVFKTILMASILLPVGFGVFFASNTTGWDATTLLAWAVIPAIGVVAVVLKMMGKI